MRDDERHKAPASGRPDEFGTRRTGGRRESDRRFAALAEYAPIGIFMTDAAGRVGYLNTTASKLLGLSLLAGKGEGWSTALHEEDRERVEEEWRRAVASGTHFQSVYRFHRRDGSIVWVEGQAAPLRNDEGKVDGWIGTIQDVSAVWSARAEIQASNDRLRAVLDASPFAILSLDAEGRVTAWSKGATRMFGWTEGELLGRQPKLQDDAQEESCDLLQRVLAGERVVGKLVYRHKKEGEPILVAVSAAPLKSASGRIVGAVVAAQDVTEIERSAELIEVLTAEREQIVQTLHDSCIQSIYGVGLNLEGCRGLVQRDPAAAGARIARAIADLNLVIHELRGFISRDGYGYGDITEARPLREEIERAIPPDSRTRFEVALDEGVESALTREQSVQLALIARESISNILRHAGARRAQLTLRRHDGQACLEIRDDGRGFDPVGRSLGHNGLGMHHIEARVTRLGGRCVIDSAPGRGTRIDIQVPIRP